MSSRISYVAPRTERFSLYLPQAAKNRECALGVGSRDVLRSRVPGTCT